MSNHCIALSAFDTCGESVNKEIFKRVRSYGWIIKHGCGFIIINYKTLRTIIDTEFDRIESRIDRAIHRPFKNRVLFSSSIEIVSKINEQANLKEPIVKSYLDSLQSSNLLEQIDYELQKNLPNTRYETIKRFKLGKDWVSILESIYILIRLFKPNSIVETGVGEIGMSSTYILAALHDNNKGHLYSIDPDKFYQLYGYHIGSGIPESLKERHTIIKDISKTSIEPLFRKIGKIDFFLHDGDHSYKTKLFEYEIAYKYLNNRGIIMSDDTWDSAFDLFIQKYKINGYSIKYGKNDFFSYTYIRK